MLNENYVYLIIVLISSCIELITLNTLLSEFVELKNERNIRKSLFILIILIFICEIIAIITLSSNFKYVLEINLIKLMISTIVISIFISNNYKIKIIKSIFISISFVVFLGLLNEIVYFFLSILCNSIVNMKYSWYYTLRYEKLVFLEVNILTKLLLIYMITIINLIKLKFNLNKKQYKYIFFLITLNLFSSILIFVTIYKTTQSITNFSLDFVTILISSIILILNIFFMGLTVRVIKDINLKSENQCIKENIKLQQKYYLNIQESQKRVRQIYHDMKNHMICIENKYGKNKYIESINNQLKEYDNIFNTNNMILDIILNDKQRICKIKGINFIVNIDFKECSFIDVSDVCSIFSNMIDNAIEACENIDDYNIKKIIKIKGTIVNKLYVIKCENTKNNKIKLKNGKILTNKRDKFSHGIGISSMKNSVEKYNGNLEINYLNDIFLVNIYIPLRNI